MKHATWYRHPQHGYMLRGPAHDGWQVVVTALVLDALEYEDDYDAWEAHKGRLRVNGGCGAIAADAMQEGDHNPAFRKISVARVPAWIVDDFLPYLE